MNLRDEHTELIALIESVLNDSATQSDVQRLDALLDADAAARTIYLDYADLHAALRRRFAHPLPEGDDGSFGATRADTSHPTPRAQAAQAKASAWRTLGLLALAASVPLAILAIPQTQTEDNPVAEGTPQFTADQQASFTGVAVLSRAVDVEWSGERPGYRQGSAVPASKLAIDSGMVQLEFYSGAVAVLEGPAEIDLIDPMSARLHSGKLRARVPVRARGFTIHTEKGEVVDLGTEFALDLGSDREWGELHVIDGEVRYDPKQESGHASRQVFGGEAMHLGREADEETLKVAGERFVGPAEIEKISRERKAERRRQWRKWRSGILSDPSLVALYGYSPEPEWSRTLRNYAPNGGGDTHGVIVGGDWAPGRWQGQRALRFRNASHRVSVNLPGEHDSITLSTWLKIDRFHPTNQVALMHPEIPQPHIIHWTLDRIPNGALLHFAESTQVGKPEEQRLHYSSVRQCIDNRDAGRWVQLATVYDAQLKRVSHYRDGELLASAPIEVVRPISIGMADIGNWPYKNWAKGTDFEVRNLMGRFDEFLVMGRAMTAEELAELYEVGKP